jgi:hypothetical protein
MNKNVAEVRYDLASDSSSLDLDSQEKLLCLALDWSARNDALAAEEPFELAPYQELDGWPCLINPNA